MKDILGNNKGKALVILLIALLTVGLIFGLVRLEDCLGHLTLQELLKGVDYYDSAELTTEVVDEAYDDLYKELLSQKYLRQGKLDEKAEVDILQLTKGVWVETPNPDTTYTIGDLLALRNSIGYAEFTQHLEDAMWENYDDRYRYEASESLLQIDPAEATESETEKELDLSGYTPTFCYLYNTTRALEIVTPKSGVPLAEYALINPSSVSLLDSYHKLKEACDEIYSVQEHLLSVQGASKGDTAYNETGMLSRYRYHDLKSDVIISNHEEWNDLSDDALRQSLAGEAADVHGFSLLMAGGTLKDIQFYGLNSEAEAGVWGGLEDLCAKIDGYGEWTVILNPAYNPGSDKTAPAQIRVQVANQITEFRTGIIVCGSCALLLLLLSILSMVQVGRVYDPLKLRTGDYVVQRGHISDAYPQIREYVEQHASEELIAVRRSSYLTRQTPVEILILADVMTWVLYACVVSAVIDLLYNTVPYGTWISIAVVVAGFITLALFQLLTVLSKWKSHHMLTNSLIRGMYRYVYKLFYSKSLTWQLLLSYGIIGFIMLIAGILGDVPGVFMLFVLWLGLFVMHIRKRGQRQKLMNGVEEIAGGNLYYRLEEAAFTGNEKRIAGQLNNIRSGMQAAIDEQMKAERLRTDLITNVSHDIKTPLTSIINYVDLLKRENIEDPKIAGYVEVLEQKSARLRQLTEDLVEASKISSGNIVLNCTRLDLVQLVKQMNGEYEERFDAKDLQMITKFPEEPMCIHADGARMNRILDNLYANAAKYAMPGSRIYVTVSELSGRIDSGATISYCILSIKNVSEQPLNVSAEELMERFVRGDVSRSTEGSGLGLEIAGNLTKLQGGTFELQVDGDLFKVELAFPRV